MAVKTDYYNVLGIQPGASEQAVKDATRKSMREWRKRTEASDLAVRQEAELKVALITEARGVLTDPTSRQQYDLKLQNEGVEAAPQAQTGNQLGDWIKQANHYLSIGDYHSAAYAAREATQREGNSAESWWIRSRANAGLERFEDAVYEAQQSVTIENANPTYHFHLGFVAENLNRNDQAISEYQAAARLDPSETMYPLAIGSVLLDLDRNADALKVIEPVYFANTLDETANFYLGLALVQSAEQVPARRESDSYMVTSKPELEKMREYINKAKSLARPPQELIAAVIDVEQHLDMLERKRFHIPFGSAQFSGPIGSAARVVGLLAIFLVLGIVAASAGGAGVMMFLIFILAGIGIFFLTYVPNWKVNARLFS